MKEYVILGGQHILKAINQLREDQMVETDEELLPASLRFCYMEVIQQGAPYSLRAFMAGRHQLTQSAATSAKLKDFFNLVAETAMGKKNEAIALAQKLEKLRKPGEPLPEPSPDRCVFTDDEVWVLLERSGLKTDEIVADNAKAKAHPSMKADEADEQLTSRVFNIPNF